METFKARGIPYICCIMALVFFANLYVLVQQSGFRSQWWVDDRIYTYTTSFTFGKNSELEAASNRVLEYMASRNYDAETISRFRFRKNFRHNYFLHAVTIAALAGIVPYEATSLDYGIWLFVVHQLGVGLGYLICFLLVFYALWLARDTDAPAIVFLAMTFSVVTYLSLRYEGTQWRLLTLQGTELVRQTLLILASPGSDYDFFGNSPRNAATLLLYAVVLFRWLGRNALSYWVIAFSSLPHATYGLLALAIFCAMDVCLRPAILRDPRVVLPIGVTVISYLMRSRGWSAFSGDDVTTYGLVIVALSLVGLASPYCERITDRLSIVARLRGLAMQNAELILLILGIGATFLVSGLLLAFTSGLAVKYIALEFSGRLIPLIRVPLVLTVFYLVFPYLRNYTKRVLPILSTFVTASIVVFIVSITFPRSKGWVTASEMQARIERSVAEARTTPSFQHHEGVLYYAISCQIDGVCRYLDALLAVPGAPDPNENPVDTRESMNRAS